MKFALGTSQFGMDYGIANSSGRVPPEEAKAILGLARQCGVDTVDTAIAYGESESVLGRVGVRPFRVITKLPPIPDECGQVQDWVKAQVLASIQRLGVDRLCAVLLHRPAQLLEHNGTKLHAAMQSLKADGFTEKIGISVYAPSELSILFNRYSFDLVQAPLNILDRRLVDSGWAERLKQRGVEVHVRSVFLQGLLLMPAARRPIKFARWAHIWKEWDQWLRSTGRSPLQGCLQYASALSCIDRVLVGVDSASQLRQIVDAATGDLANLPAFEPLADDRLINPATWNQL